MKKLFIYLFLTIFFLLSFSAFAQNEYILEFDGNDYIRYADDGETQLDLMDGASDFTIEAWIFINTWGDYNRVLQRYSCWRLYLNTNNRISFGIYYNGTWYYYHSTNNVINTGEWTHVAVIRDTDPDPNEIRLYVNGTDVTSGTPAGYSLRDRNSSNLYVGQDGTGGNFLADGYVDEVRCKNVAEDIADLQTDVHDHPYTSDANTAILFHFDEGPGNYWTDNAAGGNDGRLGGTAEGDDQEPTWRTWDYPDGDLPLPVVLSEFTAQYAADQLSIYWTTQSESNNMGWNIYRGNNENAYLNDESVQINSQLIPGAGTSSEPNHYSFIDNSEFTENATLWYWIESIGNSGETNSYGPISITIPAKESNPVDIPDFENVYLYNYPNPFEPATEIKFMVKEIGNVDLSIFNIKGQKIRTLINKNISENELDTFISTIWDGKNHNGINVNPGIYLYKLTTGSHTYTKKMILTH